MFMVWPKRKFSIKSVGGYIHFERWVYIAYKLCQEQNYKIIDLYKIEDFYHIFVFLVGEKQLCVTDAEFALAALASLGRASSSHGLLMLIFCPCDTIHYRITHDKYFVDAARKRFAAMTDSDFEKFTSTWFRQAALRYKRETKWILYIHFDMNNKEWGKPTCVFGISHYLHTFIS